jgi:type I restriction enzyme S subunit
LLIEACQSGADFNHAPKWHVVKSVTYRVQIAVSFNVGTALMLFRVEPKVATPEFLCALILSPAIQKVIWSLVGGSASPHLNVGDVKEFVAALPPLPLQKEFAARVSQIRAVQAEQSASRHRLDELFQSMLHRAFQGEL